jgi:23S rRNA (cytidine1920-2'-O)/16S rRNA (cytidine1409-2'-O)-methyltransferase
MFLQAQHDNREIKKMTMIPKPKKQRLDLLLVERGLADTRNQAQAVIMAGQVRSGDRVLTKAGQSMNDDIELTVASRPKYVGRGGDKLASVIDQFKIDFTGAVIVDVGSSTGGFTDFALQHGAIKSYCIDVGRGQLAYKLRQDQRVVVMEQTDIRNVEVLPEKANIIVGDLSFISVNKILAQCAKLLLPEGKIIILIKPQFEAGKAIADRFNGVISDDSVRDEIILRVRTEIEQDFTVLDEADSAVSGTDGNRERFFLLEPKR